jgi:hypothetical protein
MKPFLILAALLGFFALLGLLMLPFVGAFSYQIPTAYERAERHEVVTLTPPPHP